MNRRGTNPLAQALTPLLALYLLLQMVLLLYRHPGR